MVQPRPTSQSRRRLRTDKRRRRLDRSRSAEPARWLNYETLEKRELLAGDIELISVSPNFGTFIQDGTVLSERPRELTFQFTPGTRLDPASLSAIQILGSGFDGGFTEANEIVINPGFRGIGDSPEQVIFRFSQPLQDDLYRITITGSGGSPLQDINGEAFNGGVDLTRQFDLDLGATIQAVVPQPVIRDTAGVISQQRDEIIVHFNPDELDASTVAGATNLTLYQLVNTMGTVDLSDDTFVNPTGVSYDATENQAVLTFAAGELSAGTFRLRIGTTEAQVDVTVLTPALTDDDSSFATANALGSLTGANEKIRFSADITPQSTIIMPDWPGSADEPGHRQIPAETHGAGSVLGTSAPNAIRKIGFYFPQIYGRNPQNQQLTNEISANQKQRAREIFEMYAGLYGFEVMELEQTGENPPPGATEVDQAIAIVTGDIRVGAPGFPPLGVSIGGGGLVIMNGSGNYGQSEFGGSWFNTALHEIGHAIGITHSYDIPSEQGNGTLGEDQYPGNHDIVHGQRIHRPDATDIDVYSFTLPSDGTFSAEVIAERLVTGTGTADPSLLNSAMRLYRKDGAGGELIAQNDDYFSNDSFIELELTAGDYFVSISSTGNTDYDLNISDTGFGGLSDGDYDLQLTFDPVDTKQILDTTGTALDGDADGVPGGVFEFHFRTAALTDTFFVDKANDTTPGADGSGTEADPFDTISQAIAAAGPGDVIRVVANGGSDNDLNTLADNQPYLIGLLDDQVTSLADGDDLEVPADVVLQVDPGVVIKLQYANINAGTTVPGADRSGGAIQILGTPQHEVILTAYGNDAIGGDSDGVSDGANPADWGGIVFRDDSDFQAADAAMFPNAPGIFLNYVNHANISFGGGEVNVNSIDSVYTPIHLVSSRPTVSFNTITDSAKAAMSANPNSFSDSRGRIGPDIHGNLLSNNTTNGILFRIETQFGQPIDRLSIPARLDDTDIVHVLSENLEIIGSPGGPLAKLDGTFAARLSGRLAVDPGVVVKLGSSRIEGLRGNSHLIAEGTAENPVIFTSILDDRYGAGGTFDTTGNGTAQAPTPGDWGGLVFNAESRGSIDQAIISYAGGNTPIAGGFGSFNTIEVLHRADVRLTNSLIENNADGIVSGNDPTRDNRGTHNSAVVFVRQSQPIIVNNIFRDNAGSVIHINANAMVSDFLRDTGRSTGVIGDFPQFADNQGPLVRLNRLENNTVNGMQVRGETLTTESVWDDTDIVHVLRDEIIVNHHHTFSGLRLKSAPDESLVIKLKDTSSTIRAGITADGVPLDIDDRIGGTVQVLGRPQFPVVMTSLDDCTVGAGLTPQGLPQPFTNIDCAPAQTISADVIDVVLALDDTSSFENSGNTLISVFPQIVADLQAALPGADFAFSIVRFEEYAGTGGFGNAQDLRPFILNQPIIATGTTDFQLAIDAALARVSPAAGAVADETYIEALLQIATGVGFDGNGDGDFIDSGLAGLVTTQISPTAGGDVPDIGTFQPDPTGPVLPPDGTIGGVGFRTNSTQRIVLLGTDGDLNVEDDGMTTYTGVGGVTVPVSDFNIGGTQGSFGTPGGRGATIQNTVDQLIANNIKVIGLGGMSGFGGGTDVQTPLTALATLTGATDSTGVPLYFDIDPNNGALIAAAIVDAVTGVVPGLAASPGDWRGLQFNEYANDRNVRTVLENELANNGGVEVNNNVGNARTLGELAPDYKSADDNRPLGFEIHGFISADDPGDVDVYSFQGTAGVDVWFDLDRTRGAALDPVLELVERDGTVLARAVFNDGTQTVDLSGTLFPADLGGLTQNAFDGEDFYSLNYRDTGFRATLPVTGTYFVRVRSDSSNLSVLDGGLTSGEYQLQIRLNQVDEKPGSVVRNAEIRYASTGIQVQGLPAHSPLLGETREVNDAEIFSGQDIGNLLDTDRNTISVAGTLGQADGSDVDSYNFNLDYATTTFGPSIQSISGVNDGQKTWSTVFDLDYSDGLTRGDTTLVVFDGETDIPILVGFDSNIEDDQDGDRANLLAGSFGQLDPFIGPVQMPAGNPGQTTPYSVSVTSNGYLASQLDQTFLETPTNTLTRLEPVTSTERIIEDHIGFEGYTSNGAAVLPTNQNTTNPTGLLFPNIVSTTALALNVEQHDLGDVPLFVSTNDTLRTVNPFLDVLAGGGLINFIDDDLDPSTNNLSPIRDINTDSTGVIYGYRDLRATTGANTGTNNTVGTLVTVDPGTGALTAVGNDDILGRGTNLVTQTNDFEDVTISDFVGAVAIDRNAGPNNAANPVAYYAVHENTGSGNPATMFPNSKLYRANITTGAVENDTGDTGFGDIQLTGVTYADVTISVRNNAMPVVRSDITVQARAPGTDGNGITIVIDYATDNTLDVTVSGTTITIEVDDANTAGEIATAINSDEQANRLVTALVNLNDAVGTVASNANPALAVSVSNGGVLSGGGGSPLAGNVTGMSFGNFYGSASGTTVQRRLYGITDAGEFIRINTSNGTATLIRDLMADFGLTGFQGLTLGPQNVTGGLYTNLLFSIADDGTLIAINPATGDLQTVFDSDGDGTLDADRIDTGVTGATGLAFGGADINLWHPTTLVPVDSDGNPVTAGRGINPAFDFSRTPSDEPIFVTDGQGNTTEYNHSEADGGVSFYFGIETYVPTGNSSYLNYEDTRSQLGIRNNDVHRDLSDVSGGGNNYNLPGGAAGSLVTAPFDLVSQFNNETAADRPTLYFNYFLETENAEEGNPARASGGQMRDSARVYITPNGGITWELIATNNSARDDDSELPTYASVSRFADANDGRQATQELFDNTDAWRQAVIDLSDYVGLTDLQLKFDFSTSGSRNDPTLLTGDGTRTDNFGEYQTEVNDTNLQPSADNDHQGWFVDDLIIGWAERGQMITGATADRTFTQVPQDPDPNAPIEILSGPYQLEIRRGYEYGAQADPTESEIVLSDAAIPDTNARFIPGATLFPMGAAVPNNFLTSLDASNRPYFTVILPGDLVPDGGITGLFDSAFATNAPTTTVPNPGLIGPSEQAELSITVTSGDGFLTFDRFFNPEAGHDVFQVFIDGTPIAGANFEFSGDDSVGGVFVPTSVPISAGSHTVRFIHKKGPGGTLGAGHLALDNIQFPAIGGYLRSDLNLKREQGIFEISGNIILNADVYGIDVEAGTRDAGTNFAHPGSPINFETQNLVGLAPGTVIKNNIVSGSGTAGIRYAGDSSTTGPQAAVPVGKIVNNTIVGNSEPGGTQFGIGIEVANNARPTLLNNIVAETATGVSVDGSSSATVVGRTHFYRNSADGTVGQNAIIVLATDPAPPPLFVNSQFDNYYLASGSQAIDRSLGSLPDSSLFVAVKQDLEIPPSDTFSPQRDLFGQLRVDDFSQPPSGLGGESFNDVGAVERADFIRPFATLLDPLDNSVIDLDPTTHDAYVIETNFLTRLVVQLNDSGIGIDDMFVRSSQWELKRNGVVLNDGVDYTFIYNSASNQVIFQSLTIFAPDNQYTISVVDQSVTGGVRDIAGNLLQPNRPGNEIRFEVILDNGVNDPPVNSVPAMATTLEDTPLVFRPIFGNAITVSDPDAALGTNVLTVTLDPVNGTVIPTTVAGVTTSTFGTMVTLMGEIPLLNQALQGLQFVPDLNYVGSASLTILTEDNGQFTFSGGTPLQDMDTISILITPANDDPTNAGTLPSDISVTEDVSSNVDLSAVTFADIDAGTGSLTVTLTTSTGGNLSGAAGTGITLGGSPTALTISGTLTDLNNYFDTASNISYLHGTMHLNGDNADTIQVAINDNGNTGTGGGMDVVLGTVNVDISGVNDPPTNAGSLPTDVTVAEDVSSNVDLSAVSFADVDAASGSLTVTLTTSTGGNLSGATGTGIALGGSATALTISGTLTDLNNYFNTASNISYLQSTMDLNGDNVDTIQVMINDNGNTPSPGTDVNLGTVNVDISPTNDPPTNAGSLPSDTTVTEDISSNVDLSAVTFADVDAASGSLTVTLTTSTGGNLTGAAGTGITLGGSATALTVSGTLTDLNNYFDTASNISYLHGTMHLNGNDADTIQVTINDNGNTGAPGTGTDIDLGSVNVDIDPVNDDPTNAGILPTDITVTEDVSSSVDLTAVDFADLDAGTGSLTVTLTTSTGGNLSGAPGTGITVGGSFTARTISGTLTDLNNYFNTASNITYLHGTMHLNGDNADTIQVAINDNGNTGLGGGTDIDLGSVNVDISAVNDDPTIVGSLPTDINVTEDVASNVALGMNVADVDSATGNLTVILTTGSGGTLAASTAGGVSVSGSSSGVLRLTGNQTDLNTFLNDLTKIKFTSDLNANGDNADTIQVAVTDNGNTGTGGGGTITFGTVNVDIAPVNDDPTNAGSLPTDITVIEDVASNINLSRINLADVDSASGDLTITLTTGSGGTLTAVDAGGVTVGGSGSGVLTLTGNQTELNTFLDTVTSIQFTSFLNANGDNADTIQIAVTDNGNTGAGGGGPINFGSVNVDINAVNDDPTNAGSLPTDITVNEDLASDVDLSLINLSDVDSDPANLTITLTTASGGKLAAIPTGGVTVAGSGSGVLRLSGNQTNLNAFLDVTSNVRYTSSLNTNGDDADTIQINVNDNGNFGSGGGGNIDFGIVNVDIAAVNDDPTNAGSLPTNITATEDIAGNVDLSLINLADVDSATDALTVILTTGAGGTLAAADGGGVTVGGSSSGVLTLTGNLTDLNAFLDVASNIQFTSFLNANGSDADTIQVAVNDNGNTGSGGGTDINLGTVNVDISPVNDDPTNAGVLPTDITVTEDVASNVDLSPINVLDVDSASGNLAITLTTGSGGTLEATTAGGVTVGGSGSGVLTLTGNQTDLNTFLDDVTSIQFTGILNANGDNVDSIQINVTDNGNTGLGGGGTVNFGTINVDIDPVNDPPSVAAVGLGSIDEETPLLITQAALLSGSSDVDGDSLTGLNLTLTVGSGLVEDNLDGTFTFTPALNFNGPVSFSFDVNDGTVSTPNTASLTVNNLDDPPVPMDDSGALFTTNEDTSFRINASAVLANDEDPDLGPTTPEVLSIVSVSSSSEQGATVTYDPGTNRITYDPTTSDALQALAPGEALADSFTYSIRDLDGELNPPTATVFLTITGVNDAPTVVDDVVPAPTTLDPVVITPLVNDFDVDGTLDLDTLIITEDPQFGSLAKRINSFGVLELAYSPFSNFPGSDVFRYTISDNLGQQSAQATVTIQSSRAPQTGADIAGGVTGDDININVLANDVAVEGNLDTSIPTIFGSGPANGQAIPQADGTITYVANPGYLGPDSFQYTVADSAGNVSAPTLVTVRVVASGLENPLRFGDVNANGEVTSLDALIVINRIALSGGQTSIPVLPDDRGPMYYDVNGNLEITTLDALLVINHIGEDAPIISAEFVEQPIIADLSSSVDNDTGWESIDTALDAPGIDSSVQQKLVGAAADALVDRDVIDLLAEAQEASVESEEPASLNDLAILDLLP